MYLDLLVLNILDLGFDCAEFHLNFFDFLPVVIYFRRMVLQGVSEEEFPVAYAAAPAHPTLLLNVTERQVLHGLNAEVLIGEDSKLIGALLASFQPTEFTSVLMRSLQLLVADITEDHIVTCLTSYRRPHWFLKSEYWIC